jgi:hypothetical protein
MQIAVTSSAIPSVIKLLRRWSLWIVNISPPLPIIGMMFLMHVSPPLHVSSTVALIMIVLLHQLIIIGGGTWPDCSRISRSRTESSFAPALYWELQCLRLMDGLR